MNREILFRGKRVDNGEWTYGVYVPENKAIISYFEIGSFDSCCDLMNCKAVVYKVSPKTVGEYTGLTDRNGVKIFEGDIVHCCGGEFFQGYNEIDENKVVKDITDGICVYLDAVESLEVIGNIHDNPELMKGQENETD